MNYTIIDQELPGDVVLPHVLIHALIDMSHFLVSQLYHGQGDCGGVEFPNPRILLEQKGGDIPHCDVH
jgi:hypothetical protein